MYARHIEHFQKRLRIKIFVQQSRAHVKILTKNSFPKESAVRVRAAPGSSLHHLSIPHIQDLLLKYVIIFFILRRVGKNVLISRSADLKM